MLDIELYRAILDLPIPWTVLGVDLPRWGGDQELHDHHY